MGADPISLTRGRERKKVPLTPTLPRKRVSFPLGLRAPAWVCSLGSIHIKLILYETLLACIRRMPHESTCRRRGGLLKLGLKYRSAIFRRWNLLSPQLGSLLSGVVCFVNRNIMYFRLAILTKNFMNDRALATAQSGSCAGSAASRVRLALCNIAG